MFQPEDADADAIDSLFYSAVADGPPSVPATKIRSDMSVSNSPRI
jgi:hypothetical protein